MAYKLNFQLREYNLSGLLEKLDYQNESDGDYIYSIENPVTNLEGLQSLGRMLICWIDIGSFGLPLEEYATFAFYEKEDADETWDDFVEQNDIEEKERILALAKKNNWVPDGLLSWCIDGLGVGVCIGISLKGDILSIETGFGGGESEKKSPRFWRDSISEMPELNQKLNELIISFKR